MRKRRPVCKTGEALVAATQDAILAGAGIEPMSAFDERVRERIERVNATLARMFSDEGDPVLRSQAYVARRIETRLRSIAADPELHLQVRMMRAVMDAAQNHRLAGGGGDGSLSPDEWTRLAKLLTVCKAFAELSQEYLKVELA